MKEIFDNPFINKSVLLMNCTPIVGHKQLKGAVFISK
jgi:hypothetical protein